jgi:hypothetical protein
MNGFANDEKPSHGSNLDHHHQILQAVKAEILVAIGADYQ